MYSQQTTEPGRPGSPRRRKEARGETESTGGEALRSPGDDWAEEVNRQAQATPSGATETGIFAEFRRKLAMGEAISRAMAKLAEALRFSGRITISFHQGRMTKTVLEELHIRSTKATSMSP